MSAITQTVKEADILAFDEFVVYGSELELTCTLIWIINRLTNLGYVVQGIETGKKLLAKRLMSIQTV